MAKGMISAMSWVTLPFTGNEMVEVVQGGANKRMLLKDLITKGVDGKSAYELAKEDGFSGDVTSWLASLVGPQGPAGNEGPRGAKGDRGNDGTNGTDGVDGADGESAFEIYKRVKGWNGTELEWIEQVLENNGGGTGGGSGNDGRDGTDGESAYEIYKRVTGFTGTEEEYLQEIKGEKGDEGPQGPKGDPGNDGLDGTNGVDGTDGQDGESAYELAVRLGQYSGTEQEFADLLASIESVGSGGGGTGGGSGGGNLDAGLFPIGVMKIKVNDFPAGVWETPDGVTIEKIYSDSSIRVTHPFGRNPVWFSMLNVLGEPPTMYVPTSLRNMQVIDTNTFIITNANASPTYELNVIF